MPSAPLPIAVIGAGAIVRDAHLPAYRKWRLPVAGIFDLAAARARELADAFAIPAVYATLEEACAVTPPPVFDIALPPQALAEALPKLPEGAAALIQKPLGLDHAEALALAAVLEERRITAAVNFQMRFTPAMVAVSEALAAGLLGELLDIDVRVQCNTPWQDWSFMTGLAHIELPLHSIHYLDWIRAEAGLPRAVFARSLRHPDHPNRADAKSSILLDYDRDLRCCLSLNHVHRWGPEHEVAELRVEGTAGAAVVEMGYLLDQPAGRPERLHMTFGAGWQEVPLAGARVPDSFAAVMANLQRFLAGEDERLLTGLTDSLATMALLDACMRSSDRRESVALDIPHAQSPHSQPKES